MVEKLTLDNETATDRFHDSLKHTIALENEISTLQIEKKNLIDSLKLEKSIDKSVMMTEIETLKTTLQKQIGRIL